MSQKFRQYVFLMLLGVALLVFAGCAEDEDFSVGFSEDFANSQVANSYVVNAEGSSVFQVEPAGSWEISGGWIRRLGGQNVGTLWVFPDARGDASQNFALSFRLQSTQFMPGTWPAIAEVNFGGPGLNSSWEVSIRSNIVRLGWGPGTLATGEVQLEENVEYGVVVEVTHLQGLRLVKVSLDNEVVLEHTINEADLYYDLVDPPRIGLSGRRGTMITEVSLAYP